ncbi:MAG: glycosyltransferase family 4 protein [Simkaniaceae bacterium]|nr:MAG: glycosyltransferase family 4 protein [Simkaniaceae bacterium]
MNRNACPTPSLKVNILSRHFLARGGLEKWAYRIAEGFTRKGVYVNILTADTMKNPPFHPLIHYHTLPLTKWLNFQKMNQFDRLAQKWNKTHEADIIFGMDRTRRQTHIRTGNGVHAAYMEQRETFENYPRYKSLINPLNQTILKIEKEAFENPELKVLFTNSYMVKNEILEHYKVSPDKIEVIHNGAPWKEMDKDFNAWVEKKQKGCSDYNLDPSLHHFLFIGNGYQRKGLSSLLYALSSLPNRDFHLSVIGKDRNIQSFIKLAQTLGLESHVSFFGPLSDILPFFQIADTLVIPSHYDPFANVTVEALAMGLFVVSSKTNGGHEILKEGTGTIIEDLSSIDSLRASLEFAMAHPKTWIRSQTIRDSVKHLDFSSQISSYIDISLERR